MAKKSSKKNTKRRVYKRRTAAKPSLAVKRYVKRAIHSQLENKSFSIESAETLAAPSNPTTFQSGNIIQLTPSNATNSLYTIPQSLGQGGRVGNLINLRSARFKCIMYPQGYNVTSNPTPKPLDVGIWIFSVKRGVAGLTVADAWNIFNGSFFGNGNSSNGTVNNIYDLVSDVNKDVLQLHYFRIAKLGANSNILQTGGSAALANNDYKYNQILKINLTKYMPKRITFNDTDANSTSKQLFMIVSPYNADGTTIPSTNFPLSMYYGVDLVYEDA